MISKCKGLDSVLFYIASWYTLCINFFIHCDLSILHMIYFLLRNIFDIMIYTVFYLKSYLYFKDLILYSIYLCCIIVEIIRPFKLKIFSTIKHHCVVCCIMISLFIVSTQCGMCVSCWCVLFVVLHNKSIFFPQEYSLFLFYSACKMTLPYTGLPLLLNWLGFE